MTLALDPDDMLAVEAESSWSIERIDNNTTSVSIVPEVRKTSEGLRLGWGGGTDPGMYEVKRRNGETVMAFGMNPRKGVKSELTSWLAR